MKPVARLSASRLESERLALEPLRADHAVELAPVLDDITLHRFIGGYPVGVDQLRARFERQAGGASPDGCELWLNWTVRQRTTGRAVGTVQATVTTSEPAAVAELAWVIGTSYQRQGFAKEAVGLVAAWLLQRRVRCLRAHIHPEHDASNAVARSIGLKPTDVIVNGEVRWEQ